MRVGLGIIPGGQVGRGWRVSLWNCPALGPLGYWFIGRDQPSLQLVRGMGRASVSDGVRSICVRISSGNPRGAHGCHSTRFYLFGRESRSSRSPPPLGYTYAYLPSFSCVYLYMWRGFASFVLMKLARTAPWSAPIRPPCYDYVQRVWLPFQINENDDLPTNVCRKCVDNVNNWHLFKTVCAKTQNKLLSLIRKDGSLLEEVGYF